MQPSLKIMEPIAVITNAIMTAFTLVSMLQNPVIVLKFMA